MLKAQDNGLRESIPFFIGGVTVMDEKGKLQVLCDLIKINSANGNEIEVAEYLSKLLSQHGLTAKIDAFGNKRANLLLEVGQGEKILGLTGHMDTVSLGDLTKWNTNPLEPTIIGNKLYGRGASDMKSGLAAQAIALIELYNSGELPQGRIRWIVTAGEENGTPGANRFEEQGIADDLAALIVGESTDGDIIFAHSGSLSYRISSVGLSVHSSMPEKGKNAFDALVEFYRREKNLFDDAPFDEYLGSVKHSITVMHGGDQVNTIPDHAELLGNVRPTTAFGNDNVIKKLKQLVDQVNIDLDAKLQFELIYSYLPIETDPQSNFIKDAIEISQQSYQQFYPQHRKVNKDVFNGATDASVFIKKHHKLPVFIYGPDTWQVAHKINEYTTIPSFYATIDAYKKIIKHFFA